MTGEDKTPVVDKEKEDMPPSYEETSGLTGETVPEVKIAPSETKIDMKAEKEEEAGFQGLTKEELMKYANDPYWVRMRWILFILFWVVWLAMLVASIVIIIYAPKCPSPEPKDWWQKSPIYKVDLKTFPDQETGETTSTLASLSKSLAYLVSAGFGTVYLKTAELGDLPSGETDFGSKADWDALIAGLKAGEQHLVVDYSPKVDYWLEEGVDGFVLTSAMGEEELKPLRSRLDNVTLSSGSTKIILEDADMSGGDMFLSNDSSIHVAIKSSKEDDVPLDASGLKDAVDAYLDPEISWPGISLSSIGSGPEYVDMITMVKMLLPATLMFEAGEELGLPAMDWEEEKKQFNMTESHLNLFSSLSNKLRHQDVVFFGSSETNSTMGENDNVFVLSRVKKGNPGYLLAANLGETETVGNFSTVDHISETISVFAKSTTPLDSSPEDEISTFNSAEVPLKAKQTKIFMFVPNFE